MLPKPDMIMDPNVLVSQEKTRQLRVLSGRKRAPARLPVMLYPMPVERQYRLALYQYVDLMLKLARTIIYPALPALEVDANASKPRVDAWSDDVDSLVATLSISIDKQNTQDFSALTVDVGQKTSTWNSKQWQKTIRAAFGVNTLQTEPWLNDQLKSFQSENMALIKSIKDQSLGQLQGEIQRGFKSGKRHEDIAKQIESVYGTTKNRSKLIARDQVGKLNGQLTELRHKDIGVIEYKWHTSGDERVRSTHAAHEGLIFKWSEPPAGTGHPGIDFQCRCWPEAILDKFYSEPAVSTPAPASAVSKEAQAEVNAEGVGVVVKGKYAGIDEVEWDTWAYESHSIQDALAGELKAGGMSDQGSRITQSEVDKWSNLAQRIQLAASNNLVQSTGVNLTLFRGETYDSLAEVKAKYAHNSTWKSPTILSTATDRDAALKYTEEGGKVKVLIHLQNKHGAQLGIQTAPLGVPSNEVIIPRNVQYRVASVKQIDDIVHVNLYQKEEINKVIPRIKVLSVPTPVMPKFSMPTAGVPSVPKMPIFSTPVSTKPVMPKFSTPEVLPGGVVKGSALDVSMAEIRKKQVEHLLIGDKDGNVLDRTTSNETNSTTLTPFMHFSISGKTMIHNHPRSTSFSSADIAIFHRYALKRSIVESSKYRYVLMPGPEYKKDYEYWSKRTNKFKITKQEAVVIGKKQIPENWSIEKREDFKQYLIESKNRSTRSKILMDIYDTKLNIIGDSDENRHKAMKSFADERGFIYERYEWVNDKLVRSDAINVDRFSEDPRPNGIYEEKDGSLTWVEHNY